MAWLINYATPIATQASRCLSFSAANVANASKGIAQVNAKLSTTLAMVRRPHPQTRSTWFRSIERASDFTWVKLDICVNLSFLLGFSRREPDLEAGFEIDRWRWKTKRLFIMAVK
jgi:hypothetical protein